jgi:hypothetical protein
LYIGITGGGGAFIGRSAADAGAATPIASKPTVANKNIFIVFPLSLPISVARMRSRPSRTWMQTLHLIPFQATSYAIRTKDLVPLAQQPGFQKRLKNGNWVKLTDLPKRSHAD